ncbi:ribosomal protein S18-alanine N-acetyltransferase [Methanolobus sp.]|jgi:ribosomal-protein-alanine N-acetyltransferase|uniref:ribosomal protein S18-alanine N-acetyltransferase n=1 Tax=Methanolobus sp. TaxID=1874737 RepID=UPI0025E04BA8|nr:ribosomal protein S18-alanine N-acetyltransferase [Methanolobus sp.]
MIIRRALESDISEIVDIENCSFQVPWPDFLFKAHLSNPGFLVYEEGQIRGYAIVSSSEDRQKAHLQSIAVHSDSRRQGIARKLLEWCIDLAKVHGFNEMMLEVREKNMDARSFYSDNGFTVEGKIDGYYLDDNAIVMGKKI